MNDNEIRKAVYDAIARDKAIISMLPKNANWSSPEGGEEKEINSIMPVDKFDYHKHAMPVITIQIGSSIRSDYHLIEDILYIRCYNNSQKSFVDITKILSMIVRKLHRAELPLKDNRLVECVWTGTSAESVDEAYHLPYREATFTIAIV